MQLILLDPKRQRLYLRFGCLVCLLCLLVTVLINKTVESRIMDLGIVSLSHNTVSGVLMSVSLFTCLLLIFVDWQRGYRIAVFFQLIMLISSTMQTFVVGNVGALPGVVTGILSQGVLRLIRNQVRRSEQFSTTSAITDAPNLRGLERDLERRLFKKQDGWLLNIYLSRFRALHDSLGYTYANQVLTLVIHRLTEILPEDGVVADITGAQLCVILPAEADPEQWAAKALALLEEKIFLRENGHQRECYLSVYIGIAGFAADADNSQDLIKYAGTAMRYARQRGQTKILRFSQELAKEINREAELEDIVKQALLKDWFYMVYQPQYVIANHHLRGFEALLRLRLPDGTMVSPGEFIPVAEGSQLIFGIEDYTLRRAMEQFKTACRQENFIVSVNISARSMSNPEFPDKVGRIMEEIDFPRDRLELEITEYSFAVSKKQTIDNIKRLNDLGVLIALDDFGTGYTSLEQLLKLPVNLLKIDKSLIDNICNDPLNLDFVKAIIYMGHLMNCKVLSEGVEDEDQLQLLLKQECDYVQGFVWGRPLEFAQAAKLLGQA